MAMRITTKMMQNTSLRNLNTNKSRQEQLTNQLATGKKISRPSDDPVVAIRALKLNSTLDKIDQYYEKNAEDAESWLDLTSSSISTVVSIIDNTLRPYVNQACNSYETEEDRQKIITNLKEAVEEIYSIGNSDSGGRSIFTGYRTDMSLTMKEAKTEQYSITEQLTNDSIISKTFVATGDLKEINEGNFMSKTTKEYNVSTNEIYRIRLAYDDVDITTDAITGDYITHANIGYMTEANVSDNTVELNMENNTLSITVNPNDYPRNITVSGTITNPAGRDITVNMGDTVNARISVNGQARSVSISYGNDGEIRIIDDNATPPETVSISSTISTDADGKKTVEFDDKYMTSLAITGAYPSDTDDAAYMSVIGDTNANNITYVADTGEILLGANVKERLSKLTSDTELRVTYQKSNWEENDLDPVHYFYTERTDSTTGRTIKYNESFLDDPSADGKQIIEYDIGNNQTIRVNTTADELFTHNMGRDVDEVESMLNEYGSLDDNLTTIKKMIESETYSGSELKQLEEQKAAIEKAMTYVGDKINKRCSELLTDCDGYFKNAQLAETNCGSRGTRLELIQNRLSSQQTNFEELVSENEDADYTDLAIQLKSVEMTYEAALSSISYVMQTTLLDFI
jgi:flagellar hook-associated protein 3 FlgL